MRRHLLAQAVKGGVDLNHFEREAVQRRDGRKVAGWIAWTHRRSLRRTGEQVFKIPRGRQAPAWFKVGMATFESTKGWSLEVRARADGVEYVVRWLRHGSFRRKVAAWPSS